MPGFRLPSARKVLLEEVARRYREAFAGMEGEVLSEQPRRDLTGVGGWTRWDVEVTFSQRHLLILRRR